MRVVFCVRVNCRENPILVDPRFNHPVVPTVEGGIPVFIMETGVISATELSDFPIIPFGESNNARVSSDIAMPMKRSFFCIVIYID